MEVESTSDLFFIDLARNADFEDDELKADTNDNIEKTVTKKVDFSRLSYSGVDDVNFINNNFNYKYF